MRLPSIPGAILISLLISACGSATTSQAVATPTLGAIVVPPSPSAQPSATADRTPSAECVNPPADVLTLAHQADPVACYRSASLTVDTYLTGAGEIDGPCQDVEPAWLGDCGSFVALLPVIDRSKFSPSLFAAIDPTTGRVLAALLDRKVRVTGHYDDPAARLCHPTGGTPAETPHRGSDWEYACRRTFVLTSIMLLPGDIGEQVSCGSGVSGSIDYTTGAHGPKGDVLAVAVDQVKSLRPSDRVELVATDATGSVTVRVVREGKTAAVGIYVFDGAGGWLVSSTTICSGSDLSWGS